VNLQAMEKEINDIIAKIRIEAMSLEKGNKFVEYARMASEKALLSATHVIQAFSKTEQSIATLEQQIQSIDFTQYFNELKKTIEELDDNMAKISEMTGSSSADIQTARNKIREFQEKALDDIGHLVTFTIKLDETLKQLVEQVQATNQVSSKLDRFLSEANIPKNLSLIQEEINEWYRSTQDNLKLLKASQETFTRRFDEISFHQRLKDIEYSNVKFSSEQDTVRKSIEGMVAQQALLLQQVKEQQHYNETTQRELMKKLETTNTKIHIAIAVGGGTLIGVGFILSKF